MGVGVFLDEDGGFSWNFVSSFLQVIARRSRYSFDECYSNWMGFDFYFAPLRSSASFDGLR